MSAHYSLLFLAAATVLIPALVGCSRSGSSGAATTVAPRLMSAAAAPAPMLGAGTIRGRVLFDGNAPAVEESALAGNCQAGVHPSEALLVNPNRTLRNVIVYIQDAPPAPPPPAGAAIPVLDQVNCRYVPHVLALRAGQPLTVRSSDAMPHNVHFMCQVNSEENFGMLQPGDSHSVTFKAPEIFKVRCDVHAWMNAWIGVFDHPWFAVTVTDGSFQIDHVPDGQFTLAAWQETLPTQTAAVTVAGGGSTVIDFTFHQP